jgi:hypothetical protein
MALSTKLRMSCFNYARHARHLSLDSFQGFPPGLGVLGDPAPQQVNVAADSGQGGTQFVGYVGTRRC